MTLGPDGSIIEYMTPLEYEALLHGDEYTRDAMLNSGQIDIVIMDEEFLNDLKERMYKKFKKKFSDSFSIESKMMPLVDTLLFLHKYNPLEEPLECKITLIDEEFETTPLKQSYLNISRDINAGKFKIYDNKGSLLIPSSNIDIFQSYVYLKDVISWAKRRDILKPSKPQKKSLNFHEELTAREENNCKRTIGALLSLQEQKWKPHYKNNKRIVIDKLVEDFGSIDGIKKDTLDKRFKDAEKALSLPHGSIFKQNKFFYYALIGVLLKITMEQKYIYSDDPKELIQNIIHHSSTPRLFSAKSMIREELQNCKNSI